MAGLADKPNSVLGGVNSAAVSGGILETLSNNQLAALRGAGLSDVEIAAHINTLGDVQLFRGTSVGFPGNPVLQKLGLTPASTDPVVATIFSLEGRVVGGEAVVLNGGMKRFAAGDIDLGNVRSTLEREVTVNLRPSDFAAQAPNSIPVDVSRQVLKDMGIVDLPATIMNSERATQLLESTPRLTPAQTQEYLFRVLKNH